MKKRTKYQRLGNLRRKKATYAEKKLEENLLIFNNNFFKNKFQREWVFKRMRLDFFFHEVRLGIEVDGPYHNSKEQKNIDSRKENECKKNGICLVRVKNEEIYQNIDKVILKIYNRYVKLLNKN